MGSCAPNKRRMDETSSTELTNQRPNLLLWWGGFDCGRFFPLKIAELGWDGFGWGVMASTFPWHSFDIRKLLGRGRLWNAKRRSLFPQLLLIPTCSFPLHLVPNWQLWNRFVRSLEIRQENENSLFNCLLLMEREKSSLWKFFFPSKLIHLFAQGTL